MTDLAPELRQRIEDAFPFPPRDHVATPARNAELFAIKEEVNNKIQKELKDRVDTATGQEVLHF